MADDVKTEEILDDEDLEKSFNEAIEEWDKLNKSDSDVSDEDSEDDDKESLKKAAKKKKAPPKDDSPEDDDEEDEEEDEEDEEEEDMGKSVEDQLSEDAESEAAMDVEPWLRQFAKAVDEKLQNVVKLQKSKIEYLEKLVKAQGGMLKTQLQLQKSSGEMIEKIGKTELPRKSVVGLRKARFENEGAEPTEIDGADLLNKSQGWLQKGHIDLMESTKIINRVNKGKVGNFDDALDQKIKKLLKEDA